MLCFYDLPIPILRYAIYRGVKLSFCVHDTRYVDYHTGIHYANEYFIIEAGPEKSVLKTGDTKLVLDLTEATSKLYRIYTTIIARLQKGVRVTVRGGNITLDANIVRSRSDKGPEHKAITIRATVPNLVDEVVTGDMNVEYYDESGYIGGSYARIEVTGGILVNGTLHPVSIELCISCPTVREGLIVNDVHHRRSMRVGVALPTEILVKERMTLSIVGFDEIKELNENLLSRVSGNLAKILEFLEDALLYKAI